MDFKPILKPTAAPVFPKLSTHATFRAQLRIETWMLLGAVAQSLLSALLPLRVAVIPATLVLLGKIAQTYAMKTGFIANPNMAKAIMPKHSSQAPDSTGAFGSQPARDSMAVFFLAARFNGAMGVFDKKNKDFGQWFNQMDAELKKDPVKHGFLGMTTWQSANDDVNPTILNVMYFTSAARVHDYAHGPVHRQAWNWWYKNLETVKDIGISHELYEVPSGNYESVFAQIQPILSGLNQHRIVTKTEDGGEKVEWISPLVDASRGQLRTSKGRMARSMGTDNDRYGIAEPYHVEDGEKR